jgi:outer membrane protein TolC
MRFSTFTKLIWLFILCTATEVAAQTTSIRLEECYEQAKQNYPLIKQKDLLAKSLEFTIANAHSAYLPQVTINGQATYQSEVTRLPGPAVLVEPLSKDQYKIYGELNQSIYDGGTTKSVTTVQSVNTQIEQQKIEVELYKIKDRINQLFFGILLMDAQLRQVVLLKNDLQSSLIKTEAAIRNGTAFKLNADILKAELLKSDQRIIEMKAARMGYLDMLGYFTNQQFDETVQLNEPVLPATQGTEEINRPELSLYTFQSQLLGAQHQANNTRNLPRVGFFLQGGYGRPGLNVLVNEFAGYYIGGFRLNWTLSGLYNSSRDKQLLDLSVQQVNSQKETFLFNTRLSMKQQSREVQKLIDLMEVDRQIIELRTSVSKTAMAQYENGVISTNDYLRELNAEDQAKQNRLLHQVQLMLAQYAYQNTIGN